ncbi:MAG TPA: choice-of-anchor D domain-containing protein [Bryobacteraceae bacterium]|nr:choice-of-anchor D domain-containing protein [Bryobacteraceae bacterium]
MRHTKTTLALLLTCPLLGLPAMAQQSIIATAIGGGPNSMPAIDADLYNPVEVTLDSAGNYYFADGNQNRVFKVTTGGFLTVVAGNGLPGYAGDGVVGGAANALLNYPYGVAVDASGNVYISDYNNSVVRKVDTSGTITTVAGSFTGGCTYNGNGSPATQFYLCHPSGLALDHSGNLYIADEINNLVRKLVVSTSTISNYAGTGTNGYSGDGGLATSATLNYPSAVAIDSSGNVFIADTSNQVVREVTISNGKIKTIAGNGTAGYSGDGGAATGATFNGIYGIAVNSAGTTVTVADTYNAVVRQFPVGGIINTVAGGAGTGWCGDAGPATSACLYYPEGVAVTSSGTVYVSDTYNNRLRQFIVGGSINTMAGNGSASMPTPVSNLPPQGVVLFGPYGLMEDPSGNIFVSDPGNSMVREEVFSTDLVNIFAGSDVAGYSGDTGPATAAEMNLPASVARDSFGNIYIADAANCAIREVSTSGIISTFAGGDGCGFSGNGGPAIGAQLYYPFGVFVDSQNNVYIADTQNCLVRKVTGGIISTFAGGGGCAFSGDGGPANDAALNNPEAVTADAAGNVYIADTNNHRIRMVAASTGIISTVAGDGNPGFTGDGVATQNSLYTPQDVKADANGNIFIADTGNQRLRWVTPAGLMTTFAGNGTAGFSGDGALAINAELYNPTGIFEDASGNFVVADDYNNRVRSISAFAGLGVSASSLSFGIVSIGATSAPQALTLSAVGPLTFTTVLVTGAFAEADNCPATLANGQKCTIYAYFKPTASGLQTGSLTIEDNGYLNGATTIALQGSGSAISITGAPVLFGNQLVKTASTVHNVTVTNKGKTSITMGTITLIETTDFAISSNACPASGSPLAASASCIVGLTFDPQSTGIKKGALAIANNDPTSPQLVGLSGTGASNVTFAPASVTFAAQTVGTTSAVTRITLTNKTTAALTLGTHAVSVSGPFVTTAATTCTNGKVVAINGTCFIYAEFSPTAGGYATGTVTVTDGDATSPQTVALAGTGTYIKFNPSPVNFGIVQVGIPVSATVTMTNVGPTTVTLTDGSVSGPNAQDFNVSGSEPPCGGSLIPGAVCTFTAFFTPSIVGSESATLYIYDSSVSSPQTLSLTGQGQ